MKDDDLRQKYDLYGENGLNNFNKKQTHSWNSPYKNNFIYDYDLYVINLHENDYCEYIFITFLLLKNYYGYFYSYIKINYNKCV